MHPILEQISKIGLVPVIKLDDPDKAVDLAKALKKGGIPVAEITFRAAGADRAIANIAREMPEILVGAGTVITVEQVKKAVAAGAKYIISPGFDPEVVGYCVENNIPITPGCTNPSEVSVATKMGLEVVKFFPAEAAGGLKVLKALAGPFPKMKFIPTGGIGPDNLNDYLAFNKIIACGGSWMVPGKLVEAEDWDGITALAKEAVMTMLDAKINHVGINCADKETSLSVANEFQKMLGGMRETSKSYFTANEAVEVMHFNGKGTNGHLSVAVTSVERAMTYYQSQGYEFDMDTVTYDDAGKPKFVYFKNEIGGFAVHLVKK
jgi:2-dehydro-3-deoxyphosphogluconate aldolase/(4S)-4-hydroxy-2-oxoglutarate aldolase